MVTHNPALESHFDQVIRLRDGLTEDTVGEVTQ
jgi:ABC-type lipoprotein export system ATPase subunit